MAGWRRKHTKLFSQGGRWLHRYQGKSSWSAAHQRYLRELVLPHPAMKVILEEYLQAIGAAGERIERREAGMSELLEKWRRAPLRVEGL
jgi:transposase